MKYCEIGMPRTGTRSVSDAARLLGLNTSHGIKYLPQLIKEECIRCLTTGEHWLPVYNEYAYVGNVSFTHWRELAESRPEIKFILTLRDVDDWWRSCKTNWESGLARHAKHFVVTGQCNRKWTLVTLLTKFGCCTLHEERWKRAFINHYLEVTDYFSGTNRLLIMNVFQGDGWSKLAEFLGVDPAQVPSIPFPHRRKG